ncbi:hypothetical protein V6C21_04270 [[Clostridium] cellulosi]|jgi:hypothetical protein|nr:MAG: hypothetical protein DIU81_03880 [[Clostridium] cellulosi]
MRKVYVAVNADFTADGKVLPRSFTWEDGRNYEVDRIIDIRPAASLKAGGCGIRYTCRIQGKEAYMFLEGNRWFMEGKD